MSKAGAQPAPEHPDEIKDAAHLGIDRSTLYRAPGMDNSGEPAVDQPR